MREDTVSREEAASREDTATREDTASREYAAILTDSRDLIRPKWSIP